jgi:predicted Zn-dependent protease
MQQGKLNSIIAEVRSQALLQLGKKGEALQSILDSINSSPKIVAYRLHAARLYLSLDKRADAKEQIIKACDQNKDSLLPRLYMLSLLMSAGESKEAASFYQTYSKQLQEKYFGEEPIWPPGGQTFLHALFYQEDLDFIFNKLLKI